MGGKIWVESDGCDFGSIFKFTAVLEESVEIEKIYDQNKKMLYNKYVLVVDDSEDNRLQLMDMLTGWKCVPFICSSAEEALRYLNISSIKFDVAILDVNMPDTTGIELAHQISSQWSQLPLIGLSSVGSSVKGDAVFDIFESKPIEQHIVLRALCTALLMDKPKGLPDISTPEDSLSSSYSSSDGEKKSCSRRRRLLKRRSNRKSKKLPADTRVLLAEDDSSSIDILIDMLTDLGYTSVDVVNNGQEALDNLEKHSYDIALLDLKMPVMNGIDCARHIRRRFEEKERPVIVAVTASVLAPEKKECHDVGMDGHLSKPVTFADLETLMEKIQNNEILW